MTSAPHDEIGYWSEVKLDIVKDYASEYSRILAAQSTPELYHVYIDAFAGSGMHYSKGAGKFVRGSPANALVIQPSFREFHFVDLDSQKISSLEELAGTRADVHIYHGDCNDVLLNDIFPHVRYENYRRGLCLLDPYGLHLHWEVLRTAGSMKSIEIFLNFPVMDMNMNVLWRNPDRVDPDQAARLTTFWGDESWRDAAYTTTYNLFGFQEKLDNDAVVRAFQGRLRNEAGFDHVPDPIPMRNSTGAVVYYLFFASRKPVAQTIVNHIFKKYAKRGA